MMTAPPLAKTLVIESQSGFHLGGSMGGDGFSAVSECLQSVPTVQAAIASLKKDEFDLVVMEADLLEDRDLDLLRKRVKGHPLMVTRESEGDEEAGTTLSLEPIVTPSSGDPGAESPLIRQTCLFLETYLRHKKQLARQTETLKKLIEDHPDGVLVVDSEGHVLHSNSASEILFNLGGTDLAGQLIGIPYGVEESVEIEIYRKGLGPATVELKSQRTDWFGAPGHLLILHDVTERKAEETRRLAADMKNKDVQRMNSLGFLAGGIVHDFNNILGGVMPLMELAQEEVKDDHLKGFLDRCYGSMQRMSCLVKQLQDLTGKRPSDIALTDIREIVEEIHELLKPVVPKNIRLDFQTSGETLVTLGDSAGIYQSVLNICFNAIDAMPEGGTLTVNAGLRPVSEKLRKFHPQYENCKELVAVSIWDTGIGMTEETQRHIFDPFYSTKPLDSKKGRGLGLAIAWKQVKDHGGHIDVSSTVGQGTEFTVYLPSGRSIQAILQAKKMKEVTGERKRRWRRDPNEMLAKREGVLIIDDEDSVGNAFSEMIKYLGYEVTVTRSGEEGVETYRKLRSNISVVLLDLSMPDMGGEETFNRLHEINPEVKVLFITGHNVATREDQLKQQGACGAIQKPVRIEELAEKLQMVLPHSPASA